MKAALCINLLSETFMQDELDKSTIGLYALKERLDPMDPKFVSKQKDDKQFKVNGIKIDEDCMSCCLEKYRPLIREGFRMACINYNSQPVAISG